MLHSAFPPIYDLPKRCKDVTPSWENVWKSCSADEAAVRVQSICAKGTGRARTVLGQELGLFLHKHHGEEKDGNSDL